MKVFFCYIFLLISAHAISQTSLIQQLVDQKLTVTQSEHIIQDPLSKKIIEGSEKNLFQLANLFSNNTETTIFSKCHNRKITIGEVAIVLADKIEGIPYFVVFRIQNCTMSSCDNNPNFVEYYFSSHLRTLQAKERYINWLLFDKSRWKDKKGKGRKQSKEFVKQWRKALKNSHF